MATLKDILALTRPELEKTADFFKRELAKVRTGSASPSLVEDIAVEAFGQTMPLKQLAAISIAERRQIVIQPWDHSYLEPIEKALQKAQLGASPVVEKEIIRLSLPPLTQEYRQTLLKMLAHKTEETRQVMRRIREHSWSEIQKGVQAGTLREDDKFKGKDELQKLVDEYHKKLEELLKKKEAEMTL